MENIASKILYMEAAKEDVRSDISVLKRAAEKAETEVMKAQREKKRQVRHGYITLRFIFDTNRSSWWEVFLRKSDTLTFRKILRRMCNEVLL